MSTSGNELVSRFGLKEQGLFAARPGHEGILAWTAATKQRGENPWGRAPMAAWTLEELGVNADALVHWDEVEEWEDRIPMRPAVHTLLDEFEDLCAAVGVNLPEDFGLQGEQAPEMPSPAKTVGNAYPKPRKHPKKRKALKTRKPKPRHRPSVTNTVDLDNWRPNYSEEPSVAPPLEPEPKRTETYEEALKRVWG